MDKDDQKGVKSVRTVFSILKHLRDEGPCGVTELSDHQGMSKGSIHRYLSTLTDLGYTTKENGEYEIGLKFIQFGSHAKNRELVYRLAGEKVTELAEETGERVQFIAEEQGLGVYIHIEAGGKAVSTDTREGKIINLSTSAAGKAIFAFSSRSWVNDTLDEHGIHQRTSNTITNRKQLFEELEVIREQGYAINRGEHIEGLWGVAAPVRNSEGDVLGAISVSGPANRMEDQVLEENIPNQILGVTNEIELNHRYP